MPAKTTTPIEAAPTEMPERTPASLLAELHENMHRADARIGAMWPWPCMEPSDELKDAFEFIEMRDVPEELRAVVESMPGGGETALNCLHDGDPDAFEEMAIRSCDRGLYGWLAVAQHPVWRPNGHDTFAGSWGHYRSTLIFATDASTILAKATALAEKHFDQVREAHQNRMGGQ